MGGMPKGPLLCLVNPASGRGRAQAAAATLRAALSGAGWETRLEESREPGWMARRSAEAAGEFRAVVAVGGDGTVNEAAQGLRGLDTPLAVLPTGTVNLLARVYGLPAEPEGFLRVLEAWRTVPLDLGLAGERVFLSCAGAGFDAEVVRRLHLSRRGGIRIWDYLPHLAGAFAAGTTSRIRARLNGEDCGTFSQVIVGNLPLYAGILRFTPEALGGDGRLDVALFPGGSRRDLMRYALAAARGLSASGVLLRRASGIRLESDGPTLLQLDGDMGGSLPVTLGIQPGALRLLVP
jgi:diacylglycerol kinase family enzyme